MFRFLQRLRGGAPAGAREVAEVDFSALADLFPAPDGLCRPDWEALGDWVEGQPEERWDALYTALARHWVEELARQFGGRRAVHASREFLLLTPLPDGRARLLLDFAERARKEILRTLEAAADDAGYGPHVLIHLPRQHDYYRYVSHFHPDGEWPQSGGMHIRSGYHHMVLAADDQTNLECTVAHELTHAVLEHLDLPLWLEEGLTQTMERRLSRYSPPFTRDDAEKLVDCWRTLGLAPFWSGLSWQIPGDPNECSYRLALLLTDSLLGRHAGRAFQDFVLEADPADAGEAASRRHLGRGLGDQVADLLGPGNWAPPVGS